MCTFNKGYTQIVNCINYYCAYYYITILLNEKYTNSENLPFVTMSTILKPTLTGSLTAPGFLACTVTVPALHKGSPVRVAVVMGCSTDME